MHPPHICCRTCEARLLAAHLHQAGKPGARRPHAGLRPPRQYLDRPDSAPGRTSHWRGSHRTRAEHPAVGHVQRRNDRRLRDPGGGKFSGSGGRIGSTHIAAMPSPLGFTTSNAGWILFPGFSATFMCCAIPSTMWDTGICPIASSPLLTMSSSSTANAAGCFASAATTPSARRPSPGIRPLDTRERRTCRNRLRVLRCRTGPPRLSRDEGVALRVWSFRQRRARARCRPRALGRDGRRRCPLRRSAAHGPGQLLRLAQSSR